MNATHVFTISYRQCQTAPVVHQSHIYCTQGTANNAKCAICVSEIFFIAGYIESNIE